MGSESTQIDLVVFGQSFHWVEPESALTKVVSNLRPAGRLVLMWNRIIAVDPSALHLEHIETDHGVAAPSAPVAAEAKAAVIELLERHGFSVDTAVVSEELSYSTDDWLNLQFTYSNHLILEQSAKTELRERLRQSIGPQGVRARNEALALVCTRTAD
jgi:hypothetical protein